MTMASSAWAVTRTFSASAADKAIGFSTKTGRPRRIAARTISAWVLGGEAMMTPSRPLASIRPCQSSPTVQSGPVSLALSGLRLARRLRRTPSSPAMVRM